MKILLCNVSWMKWYSGISEDDTPKHGGDYVRKHGYGHEAINFKPHNGVMYGFVQLRTGTININRLDPDSLDKVEDVLVVWRARSNEGSVVVGWYKHATVYRQNQKAFSERSFTYRGKTIRPEWIVKADAENCFRVLPRQRVFRVPVTHKGFGSQTFISFLKADIKEVKVFKAELLNYIAQVEKGVYVAPRKGRKWRIDQARKLRIERSAINVVSDYYINRGYDIRSVEKEHVGYDLVASLVRRRLLIEVKGTSFTSDTVITVNLSPNEYQRSKSQRRRYRICIVTGCLSSPIVHEFVWNDSDVEWQDENSGTSLGVAEVISANLTITRQQVS
ncbi:MAG: DUF3883 domain-containing protein [Verrucomicrobiia bacterium]